MDEKKHSLAGRLAAGTAPFRALIGFDGFVDEIVHVVKQREDAERFTRVETIGEYADRLGRCRGLSTNLEIVVVKEKLGGNGPIFANALKKHNVSLCYIGCLGKRSLHPVFAELAEGAEVVAVADPAKTEAYEFQDGKIIVSKLDSFRDLTWDNIVKAVGLDSLLQKFCDSDLIGMENWTMLPHMSDIWKKFLSELLPALSKRTDQKTVFFDLADPEKRSAKDIAEALALIGEFTRAGMKTVLGLNKKEGCELLELFGTRVDDLIAFPLEELCRSLFERIDVSCLVIHPVDCACCFDGGGYFRTDGPYCAHPLLTTGAGDNFNAGFMLGRMNGYPPEECLLLGVASSGFYVRNARSASTRELADFLLHWQSEH